MGNEACMKSNLIHFNSVCNGHTKLMSINLVLKYLIRTVNRMVILVVHNGVQYIANLRVYDYMHT